MLCNGKSFGIIATYLEDRKYSLGKEVSRQHVPRGDRRILSNLRLKGQRGKNFEGSLCSVDVREMAHLEAGSWTLSTSLSTDPDFPPLPLGFS